METSTLQFKVVTGWSCWLSLSLVLFLFRLCHNCVSDRSWNWRDGTTAAGGIGKRGQREKMRSAKTCLNFTRILSAGFRQLLQEHCLTLELSKSKALTKCQLGVEMLRWHICCFFFSLQLQIIHDQGSYSFLVCGMIFGGLAFTFYAFLLFFHRIYPKPSTGKKAPALSPAL